MQLKPETINLIKKRRDLKEELCTSMGWTMSNLYNHLSTNKPDGELTKIKPANIISENLNKPATELYQ